MSAYGDNGAGVEGSSCRRKLESNDHVVSMFIPKATKQQTQDWVELSHECKTDK